MALSFDARGDDSYESIGGFIKLPAGRYHVEIVEVDESQEKHDKILVTFEVLAGTIPDYAGKRHTEFFGLTEAAIDRLKRLAMVCGLIDPGEEKDVSFEDAVGQDLIVEFVPNDYVNERTGKEVKTTQMGYGGFWKTDNSEVKEVPRGKVSEGNDDAASGDDGDDGKSDGGGWDNV